MEAARSTTGPAHCCRACQHPRASGRTVAVAATTLESLRREAENGCVTCGIFAPAIQVLISEESKTKPEAKHTSDVEETRVNFEFQMSYLGDSLNVSVLPLGLRISFFATEYTPWLRDTLPDLPRGQPIPNSTNSDASVEWTKQQLQQCVASHASCQISSQGVPLQMPSRILDIGTSHQDDIRLIDSLERRPEPYACLSYCWGRSPFLTTRSSNIGAHRGRILWDALPLTFRDTITYVRKLGVRYLWIDSLCIVQDDPEDWRQESSKMATVYQNAYIVIAASKSADAHGGLFTNVDEAYDAHVLPVHVRAPGKDEAREEQVWFRRSPTHFLGPVVPGSRKMAAALPTLSRGWIFQERILGSRILHFGPEELLWECQQLSTCQCTAASEADDTAGMVLPSISWGDDAVQPKSALSVRSWVARDDRELMRCWHSLVEEYSRLHLTHETDIFPAFSGVTKLFRDAFQSTNLAGLWRKSLLTDLLWHVVERKDSSSESLHSRYTWGRPRSWRAPTWSWASVSSAVKFIDTSGGLDACCEVREAGCEAVGMDSTAELAAGFLILQGNMIPSKLRYSNLPSSDPKPWNLYRIEALRNRVSNVWADVNTSAIKGADDVPDGSEVYCFPIGVRKVSGAVECLLLQEVAGEMDELMGLMICRRLGLVEIPRGPRDGLDEWVDSSRRTCTVKII